MRKYAVVICALALGISALVATGASGSSKASWTVGFVNDTSGFDVGTSLDEYNGAKVAVAQIDAAGGVDGHQIVLKSVPTDSTPAGGAAAMRALAGDGVHAVIGGTDTEECSGIAPLAAQLNIALVTETCVSETKSNANQGPSVFRTSGGLPRLAVAFGKFICGLKGVTTIDGLELDLTAVTASVQLFSNALKKCGKSFGEQILVPLTATDMLPYMTQFVNGLGPKSAQNTLFFFDVFEAQGQAALKLLQPLGIPSKVKALLSTSTTWTTDSQAIYPQIPLTFWIGEYNAEAWHTSINKQFVNGYLKAHNVLPSGSADDGYTAVEIMAAGLKKAGTDNPAKLSKALSGLVYSDPQGTTLMSPTLHQAETGFATCTYLTTAVHCAKLAAPGTQAHPN